MIFIFSLILIALTATITGNGESVTRSAAVNVRDCGGMLKSAKITNEVGSKGFAVTVFPNPVSEILNIYLKDKEPNVDCKIELMDIKGVVISKLKTKNLNVTINTLNLTDGVYMLGTRYQGKETVNKVIITHTN